MGGVLVLALALCPPTRRKSSDNSNGQSDNKTGDLHIENEAFVYHDALKAIEHGLRKSQMHGADNGEDEDRNEGVTNEDSNRKRKSNGAGARASRKGRSKRGKSPYRIRF